MILTETREALLETLSGLSVKRIVEPKFAHFLYQADSTPALGDLPCLEIVPQSVATTWTLFQNQELKYTLSVNLWFGSLNIRKMETLFLNAVQLIRRNTAITELTNKQTEIGSPSILYHPSGLIQWSFPVTISRYWNPRFEQTAIDETYTPTGNPLTDLRLLLWDCITAGVSGIKRKYLLESNTPLNGALSDPAPGDLPAIEIMPVTVRDLPADNKYRFLQYPCTINLFHRWYQASEGETLWEETIGALYQATRIQNESGFPLLSVDSTVIDFTSASLYSHWAINVNLQTKWIPQIIEE